MVEEAAFYGTPSVGFRFHVTESEGNRRKLDFFPFPAGLEKEGLNRKVFRTFKGRLYGGQSEFAPGASFYGTPSVAVRSGSTEKV